MRRLSLLLVLVAAAALAALPAHSEPNASSGSRVHAQQVLAQVDALDRQIGRVAEAYDLAGVELARTRRRLQTNSQALRVARHNLSRAQETLASLLVAKYEDDEAGGTLAVLIGAGSLGDLIDRLDAVQVLGRQDTRVLEEVLKFKRATLAEQRRLRDEQAAQQTLRQTLGRRNAEIEGQLAERRRLLGSIQAEVARLQAQERTRQQRLRSEVEARLTADPPPQNPTPVVVGAGAVTPEGLGVAPPTRHAHVVPIALQYLGTPYRWGGASPGTGFDCSGFVLYVYAQVGVALPHNALLQYGYGVPVGREDLQPGDIVFFDGLGHDGIYIGGGQFVQAPKTGDVVKISSLSEPWYAAAYVGARRLP